MLDIEWQKLTEKATAPRNLRRSLLSLGLMIICFMLYWIYSDYFHYRLTPSCIFVLILLFLTVVATVLVAFTTSRLVISSLRTARETRTTNLVAWTIRHHG